MAVNAYFESWCQAHAEFIRQARAKREELLWVLEKYASPVTYNRIVEILRSEEMKPSGD